MEGESKRGSWWQTIPGILTALAGIITSGAGLLAALHQAGIIGRGDQPPTQLNQASKEQADKVESAPSVASGTTTDPSPSLSSQAPKPITGAQPKYAVTFPSGNEAATRIRGQPVVITMLGAKVGSQKVDSQYVGKLVITFNTRMLNNGSRSAPFWDDFFRLIIDGVPRAPIKRLITRVEPRSAMEGDVVFEIPQSAKTLLLSVEGEDNVQIPITLEKLG